MALSMDEQRILAEIEQHLARTEPRLAARLSGFGRTSHGWPSQRARAHIVTAIALTIVVAAISLVVYALLTLRSGQASGTGNRSTAPTRAPAMAPRVSASPQVAQGSRTQSSP